MSVPEGYKSLGKIGISYKGDYNSNTAYDRLDAVFHNGSTYLAIKDAPDGAPRDDKTNWIYLAKGYDGETVDVAEAEIAFTDSETRENIVSGEKVSTVFGKIKKFFTDLTAPAFAQMITTKEDLLATKVTGYVPDAKAVADVASELTRNLKLPTVYNGITPKNGYTLSFNNSFELGDYIFFNLTINGSISTSWITIAELQDNIFFSGGVGELQGTNNFARVEIKTNTITVQGLVAGGGVSINMVCKKNP